jgi:hypothetical protein
MIITYHDFSNLSSLALIDIGRLAVILSLLLARIEYFCLPFFRLRVLGCNIGRPTRSSLLFQGSRLGLFYDVSTGDSCSLRIPFDRLRAAASPIDTP